MFFLWDAINKNHNIALGGIKTTANAVPLWFN